MTRQVVLFAAATAATGAELWITDGTPGGTRLLKDLMPGEDDSAPSDFTNLGNGKTLFVAAGDGGGNTLWVTDGTPAGTVPLDLSGRDPGVDMMPIRTDEAKQMLALGDGRAVFTGSIGEASGVWVTDGTASCTELLLEADVGTYDGPSGYTSLGNGRVLFNASHEAYGEELWVTDGTRGGTMRLADLAPGEFSSTPSYVTPIGNGKALFVASDGRFDRNLYITDGRQSGTSLLKRQVDEALISLGGGRVLFTTTHDGLTTPWLTDGTAVGTKRIADVDLHGVAGPTITLDGGATLFVGTASGEADGVWITDGSVSGTFGLNLHLPEAYLVSFAALGAGRVLAAVDDTAGTPGNARVWVSNGTLGGTQMLREFVSFDGEVLTSVGNGQVVFAAREDAEGPVVPWVTDGTAKGTMSLSGVGAGASAPTGFAAAAFADLPVVSITGQASKDEGDAGTVPFALTLTRTGDLGAPLSVTYTLKGAEGPGGRPAVATDFADRVLPSGTATFAAGSAVATVTLNVAGDTEYSPDKLFTLALSSPEDGLSVTLDTRVMGTIRNDDTGISIQADAAEWDEGKAGTTTAFTFTVTRHGDASEALTIPYTVSGAGANPASAAQFKDGKYPSGSVFFAPRATQGKITVQVRGDSVFEPDMTFAVALSDPAASVPPTFLSRSASAIIRDDDEPPVLRLTATDADKTETAAAETPFRFTLTRTGNMVGEFRVGYVVTGTGNTPATAADFASGTALSGTILFPSVSPSLSATSYDLYLPGADNFVQQPDRTFSVTLLPTLYAQIASGTASGIIRDDDAAIPPAAGGTETGDVWTGGGETGTGGGTIGSGGGSTISVMPLDASKAEGDTGTTAFTFALTRTGDLSAAGGVAYRVIGAGANPAAAHRFAGGAYPSGTLVFAPGQASLSLTVQVAGNLWEEPNAAFQVVLEAPIGNVFLGTATASGIILNDDVYRTAPSGGAVQDAGGNQRYVGTGGADVVRVTSGARGVSVNLAPNGDVYLSRAGQTDVLRGIGAVQFIDGRLVFDPADPAAQVARLYRAGLGRSADQGGLGYWTESIQDGATLGQLAASFLDSPEFTSRFGHSLGHAEFVQRLYQNVLGRAPDPSGQAYWTGVLARGADRATVLAAISESAENRQTTAPLVQAGLWQLDPAAAQAARMYDTVFGRLPDAGGLTYWASALGAGSLGLQDMADGFVASPEFQAVYGTLLNREFVAEIYTNTLRRPGDAGGIEYWTARLNEGATRAGLVVGFSESAEHRDLTAANIMGDTPGRYGIATM